MNSAKKDMSEVPTFFFFVPIWAFLFGYYAVTRSQLKQSGSENQGATLSEILYKMQQRLGALEATSSVHPSSTVASSFEIGGLVYS